jgi:hypothetical protein
MAKERWRIVKVWRNQRSHITHLPDVAAYPNCLNVFDHGPDIEQVRVRWQVLEVFVNIVLTMKNIDKYKINTSYIFMMCYLPSLKYPTQVTYVFLKK